ncbi:MAG: NAD(P)-dependent oxidoreductase [bacterium]|nr:NAD(P)-dependent oxidoreductase [bacterium]
MLRSVSVGPDPLRPLVRSEEELEDLLSRPSARAIAALSGLTGDVVVLGAGGKMGPSLARMARRALDANANGVRREVIAVSRFSAPERRAALERDGVRTRACDLLDPAAVAGLPDATAVLFLAGVKFGTGTDAARTWAVNTYVPGLVAQRYRGVPTVAFSSGNVYPFVPTDSTGATEDTPPAPVGEYASSVLGRERVFEHFARAHATPTVLIRLNYAAELRYGVPVDIARKVLAGEPIDLAMGYANVIWQGDANAMALAALGSAATPAHVINLTGPERVSIRALATTLGERLGRAAQFTGTESGTALLSDASNAIAALGPLTVPLATLTEWVAAWARAGGAAFDLPTHYEARDGSF